MPGIPCVYYGSEWGIEGEKQQGDALLRPALEVPQWNELTERISEWIKVRQQSPALSKGSFRITVMTNQQIVFEREYEGERMLIACNCADYDYSARGDIRSDRGENLVTRETVSFSDGIPMPPYSLCYWKV